MHAQGFVTKRGEKQLLLINKCDRELTVKVPAATGARVVQVDTAFEPPAEKIVGADENIRLGRFGVAVVTLE